MTFKKNSVLLGFIILILVGCSSCRPNGIPRPQAPLCTSLYAEPDMFECTIGERDITVPSKEIMGTTMDGYLLLEKYVDDLEKEVIRLRRTCK